MPQRTRPARSLQSVVDQIILVALRKHRFAVPGYTWFEVIESNDQGLNLKRAKGTQALIRRSVLERAVQAVREDPRRYIAGPSSLRSVGITHVTSPAWSLVRLLSLNDLTE